MFGLLGIHNLFDLHGWIQSTGWKGRKINKGLIKMIRKAVSQVCTEPDFPLICCLSSHKMSRSISGFSQGKGRGRGGGGKKLPGCFSYMADTIQIPWLSSLLFSPFFSQSFEAPARRRLQYETARSDCLKTCWRLPSLHISIYNQSTSELCPHKKNNSIQQYSLSYCSTEA